MKATLYLIAATSLWGLNFHFARLVLPEANFLEGGFWRYFFACAILLLVNLKKLPPLSMYKGHLKGIFSIGAIGLFGFNVFFFLGMKHTSGVNGALIMGMNPAITLLFSSLILKTIIKPNHILGMLIASLGVLFLLLQGDFSKLINLSFGKGDLLVFISVIFFALHHVWVKKYSSTKVSSQQLTVMTATVCLLCFSLTLPFTEVSNINQHSNTFWFGALGIGCIGTGLSYLMWNRGVQITGANKAGVFVNLVPLSAGLSASLFGETLHSYHFISGAVIIVGLVTMQINFTGLNKKLSL